MLTICIIMIVLNIANLIFTLIENINLKKSLTIFKYIGISLSIILTTLLTIFYANSNISLCVAFMSIMFFLCPIQLSLNAIFAKHSVRKIFKYLIMCSYAIQIILIIIFCSIL